MVLLLSSIIRVNSLAKLSIDVLEGRGAIFGNLFRKGDNDTSRNKKTCFTRTVLWVRNKITTIWS